MDGKEALMAHADSGPHFDARLDVAAENALRARQNAQMLWRRAKAVGRAVADGLKVSAESQDRIARSYERVAEDGVRGDEYREHAAVHRKLAQQDRRMAERLRRLTER
jgi:hypothetical protein